MLSATTSQRERLIEQLDDKSNDDLFQLLNVDTQNRLQREFVADHMDADDRESIVFAGVEAYHGHDKAKVFERMHRLWLSYLQGCDLLGNYRSEIEENWIGLRTTLRRAGGERGRTSDE